MDLWVDHRRELVYAFLATISLGPALTILFLAAVDLRRTRAIVFLLWILFAIGMIALAPEKFNAVANVAWRYVIEPNVPEPTR